MVDYLGSATSGFMRGYGFVNELNKDRLINERRNRIDEREERRFGMAQQRFDLAQRRQKWEEKNRQARIASAKLQSYLTDPVTGRVKGADKITQQDADYLVQVANEHGIGRDFLTANPDVDPDRPYGSIHLMGPPDPKDKNPMNRRVVIGLNMRDGNQQPLTWNRSSDPDDKVAAIPVDQFYRIIQSELNPEGQLAQYKALRDRNRELATARTTRQNELDDIAVEHMHDIEMENLKHRNAITEEDRKAELERQGRGIGGLSGDDISKYNPESVARDVNRIVGQEYGGTFDSMGKYSLPPENQARAALTRSISLGVLRRIPPRSLMAGEIVGKIKPLVDQIPSEREALAQAEETIAPGAWTSGKEAEDIKQLAQQIIAEKTKAVTDQAEKIIAESGGGISSRSQIARPSGMSDKELIDLANEAIKDGADREAVLQRLKAMGVKFKESANGGK